LLSVNRHDGINFAAWSCRYTIAQKGNPMNSKTVKIPIPSLNHITIGIAVLSLLMATVSLLVTIGANTHRKETQALLEKLQVQSDSIEKLALVAEQTLKDSALYRNGQAAGPESR